MTKKKRENSTTTKQNIAVLTTMQFPVDDTSIEPRQGKRAGKVYDNSKGSGEPAYPVSPELMLFARVSGRLRGNHDENSPCQIS